MSEKVNEELKGKKRPGRKAMTPGEKEAASKARAVKKKQADRMKPEIILQFHGTDISMDDLVEAAKQDFRAVKKRTPITSLSLYVKPEEKAAYYVVNEGYTGSVIF